jgi:hypothetical protein
MDKNICFKIDVSIQDTMPLVDSNKKSIKRLNCGQWYTLGDPVWVDADPFLFVHNDRLFLFYEDMHFYHYLGVIKMISTTDLVHWTKPVLITKEPNCHFSYPFVFEDNGSIYMMPETGGQHNIRLYKADNDELTSFSLHKVIMQRTDIPKDLVYDYADSCIYKKDGLYYLFTSTMTKESYYLYIYISNKLEGPYSLHPSTPAVKSNKFGRCAGSLLMHDGHLYRYAQDCGETYGGQVHLLEIDELTPTSFKEHVVKENILPKDQSYYHFGGHQVNFAQFKGKTIIATDAKDEKVFYLERIWGKIARMLHIPGKNQVRSGCLK